MADFGRHFTLRINALDLSSILDGMKAIPYTTAREKLASTMEEVVANHAPVIITRNGSGSVVMPSLEDYESTEEAAYWMSSPANAARLSESIRALKGGQGIVHKTVKELPGEDR